MKKWIAIAVGIFLLCGAIYFGSPYYAARQLRDAALAGDKDALEAGVDFPAVRESLKSQLSAVFMHKLQNDPEMQNNPFAGLGAIMAPALVDRAVDAYITPDGIAAAIRGQKPAESDKTEMNPEIESQSDYVSLERFRVKLHNTKLKQDGPSLLFERRGFASWKLIRLELPDSMLLPKA